MVAKIAPNGHGIYPWKLNWVTRKLIVVTGGDGSVAGIDLKNLSVHPSPSRTNPYRPFTKIAKRPSESRKQPFDFAAGRLSFLTPESQERSFSGENHLFELAVDNAAVAVGRERLVTESPVQRGPRNIK